MSIVQYHRCDMCGDLIVDESKMGCFQGATWPECESGFELCARCSVAVQRFIHEHGKEEADE